jgi:hypothetical protein
MTLCTQKPFPRTDLQEEPSHPLMRQYSCAGGRAHLFELVEHLGDIGYLPSFRLLKHLQTIVSNTGRGPFHFLCQSFLAYRRRHLQYPSITPGWLVRRNISVTLTSQICS